LIRAIENDLDSFRATWDPPPKPLQKVPSEMDRLFRELEKMEQARNSGTRH